MAASSWHEVENADGIRSPALLVYPDRIEENISRMLAIAGGAERLRPHVKTHKMAEAVAIQMRAGIRKFKCATLSEAKMLAACGASDVLVAMQLTGSALRDLAELREQFSSTDFAVIADDGDAVREAAAVCGAGGSPPLRVFIDIDCGMGRTGVAPGNALPVCRAAAESSGVAFAGLHVYDGHVLASDREQRRRDVAEAWRGVDALRDALAAAGIPAPTVIAGGTPTFPIHAENPDAECSPGTCILWDAGYTAKLPDLDFLCAAVLLTRVVSKPRPNRLCLDLGHKAVAAENPLPNRVRILGLDDAEFIMHSEEHLVIETPRAGEFPVGSVLYGIPWHICPTVALHDEAVIIRDRCAAATWQITARRRHRVWQHAALE